MKTKITLNSKDPYRWHKWFAWYPVWVDDHTMKGIVWLETIHRCRFANHAGSWWEYATIED